MLKGLQFRRRATLPRRLCSGERRARTLAAKAWCSLGVKRFAEVSAEALDQCLFNAHNSWQMLDGTHVFAFVLALFLLLHFKATFASARIVF